VLPQALPGMLTGTVIGMVRAAGESGSLLTIGMAAFMADIPRRPLGSVHRSAGAAASLGGQPETDFRGTRFHRYHRAAGMHAADERPGNLSPPPLRQALAVLASGRRSRRLRYTSWTLLDLQEINPI
jgi:hypothetical protein